MFSFDSLDNEEVNSFVTIAKMTSSKLESNHGRRKINIGDDRMCRMIELIRENLSESDVPHHQ
jgi:hypothetical protein